MDLLGKMKEGISKGIDTIGAKGKELVEETQLQLQISGLQGKREKALEELGGVAYALFRKGALADPAARGICESIAAIEQQIAARRTELGDDQQKQPLPVPPPAAGTALVRCDCGAEIASGVRFCSICGKKTG